MIRHRQFNFWFWVALVALATNPMVLHLLLSLLTAVMQYLAFHLA